MSELCSKLVLGCHVMAFLFFTRWYHFCSNTRTIVGICQVFAHDDRNSPNLRGKCHISKGCFFWFIRIHISARLAGLVQTGSAARVHTVRDLLTLFIIATIFCQMLSWWTQKIISFCQHLRHHHRCDTAISQYSKHHQIGQIVFC